MCLRWVWIMVALQIVWDLVLRSYVPVLIHDALPVTDYQSLHHFVRSCVAVGFFISSFSGTLTSSSILGSLDSKYLDKLNSYLGPVLQSPASSRFVRCWHAKTDGWAASTFHSNCDGKGPTVTIVQVGNYIFGGYVDKSWEGEYLITKDPGKVYSHI